MFSRHLCSYIVLLLNDCSTTMVNIFCISFLDCNNPLIMIHLCSKYSISIIKSIILANVYDLSHCATWALFPFIWKIRYYFLYGGRFIISLWVVLLSLYFSDLYTNKTCALVAVTMWLFFWLFQTTRHCNLQRNL